MEWGGGGGKWLQLIKLPVSEIPRILKDETCFRNSGREGGGVVGRGIAENETKRQKGGTFRSQGGLGVECIF